MEDLYDILTIEEKASLSPQWPFISANFCSSFLPDLVLMFIKERLIPSMLEISWQYRLFMFMAMNISSFRVSDHYGLFLVDFAFPGPWARLQIMCFFKKAQWDFWTPTSLPKAMGSHKSCVRLISHCQCQVTSHLLCLLWYQTGIGLLLATCVTPGKWTLVQMFPRSPHTNLDGSVASAFKVSTNWDGNKMLAPDWNLLPLHFFFLYSFKPEKVYFTVICPF